MKFLNTATNSLGKIFFVGLLILISAQVVISALIAYPPNEEQLNLVFFLPLNNYPLGFWIIKLLSLLFLVGSVIIFHVLASKIIGVKKSAVASLLVVISPASYALWNLHPFDCFKVFFVMVGCFLVWRMRSMKTICLGLFLITLTLVVLSRNNPRSNIPIFTAIKPSLAEDEIKSRLNSEMSLVDQVDIPLSVKRIAYNKPYFIFKNVINLVIKYGDIETVFFQEVNNFGQKSFVLFFWPEFILFVFGFFWLARSSSVLQNKFIVLLITVSFIDFLLLNKPPYQQFFLSLFPLSVIISFGIVRLGVIRIFSVVSAFGIGFSFLVNYFDVSTRPTYWLDNRPLVYKFIFQEVKIYQNQNYHFYITSLVGKPELYCRYYLGICQSSSFTFDSFRLKDHPPKGGSIYAGFQGEFVGEDVRNDIPPEWASKFPKNNLTILATYTTRDTIAYHFGDTAVVAVAK